MLTTLPVTATTVSFPMLVTASITSGVRDARTYALDYGVDEEALIRYANGAFCDEERQTIQGVIARNKWARNFVVNHVKRKRKKHKDAA